ncbi:MAG TPA: hypothetical protein VFH73_03235, partial [Polyangia bacterium]|nr:hypothetical protein [Polyangia bacterium]
MRPKDLLRFTASLAVALLGFASVAHAQNQPPPGYNPPPGYQQQPPPIYQQQPPPPAYQQAPAYYPPPPPPPHGMYREGLLIGFGLGFGALTADACGDYCGGALALQFDIGAMLNPRMGIMFDGWVNVR